MPISITEGKSFEQIIRDDLSSDSYKSLTDPLIDEVAYQFAANKQGTIARFTKQLSDADTDQKQLAVDNLVEILHAWTAGLTNLIQSDLVAQDLAEQVTDADNLLQPFVDDVDPKYDQLLKLVTGG